MAAVQDPPYMSPEEVAEEIRLMGAERRDALEAQVFWENRFLWLSPC
jgi:hypothetical protein